MSEKKDPYRLEVEIPGLPKTTNAGGRAHWSAKVKEARHWIEMVALVTAGKRPRSPLPKVKLTLTRYSSREPDYDGCVSTFKHVIDGLVHARIITDDKISNIGSPTYCWVEAKPNQGKVRVIVEEVS